ncbi:7446_t:CDS:2 [Entrophospora sp. SA101]|nr:7446_t:CDS:2 [Entrophospora sp. SA101]
MPAHFELDAIFNWYQSEPELRVAIITGSGDKAFCVGQDLKTDFAGDHVNINDDNQSVLSNFPSSGFGGLSRRASFNEAAKAFGELASSGKLSNEEKLEGYGLFKQATIGDNTTE